LSGILASLHLEHLNIVKLIDLAHDSLREIELEGAPDLELLEDVMKYATGYADVHHHPTEDVVFEHLRSRAPEMSVQIDAVLAEHEKIVAKGKELLEIIQSIEEGAMVQRSHVLEVGREYLEKLREHMSVEETELFPAARERLDETDWRQIEDVVGQQSDPLFGPALEREFERLWNRIQVHQPIT